MQHTKGESGRASADNGDLGTGSFDAEAAAAVQLSSASVEAAGTEGQESRCPLPTQTSRAEVAFAERFVAEAPDLDVSGKDGDVLREVLVHMIEEYARHNGHVDLLRERIDGRVGQ